MNLVALLEERAAEHPDASALIDCHRGVDRVVSFEELFQRVAAGGAMLESIGLSKGMTVLVFHPASIELYEFLLAAFHRGLQVMLADPSGGREFLQNCCARRTPDAFFGSWKANLLRLSNPALRKIPIAITAGPWFPGTKNWSTEGKAIKLLELDDEHPALITFTSGSTGLPKAAVRSHGFLLAQQRALSESLQFKTGEVDLITLPVFVLANLASGLTSVLAATDLAKPGDPDATAIHAQCLRHRVTRCAASPAFFEGLLRAGTDIPPLQSIYTGGAPVFPDLLDRLRQALPQARIESVYGSTEAEPIAHFSADGWDEGTRAITAKGGGLCSGLPVEPIRLRVIKDHCGISLGPFSRCQFDELQVPLGEAGEIVVAGEHVLQGYLEGLGDEETKIQVEGSVWRRTGDAGWIDELGRLWMLGRCSAKLPNHIARIKLPKQALCYPLAIECALRESFPHIRTAALDWQGKPALAIGAKCESTTLKQIQMAAAQLGIDQHFHFDALPLDRRHNAKIDYPSLKEMIHAKQNS